MPTKLVSAKGNSVNKKNTHRLVKSSWKDAQSAAKSKKRTKLAIGVLMIVGVLLLASWMIKFAQGLFSPWQQTGASKNNLSYWYKNYLWDGEFNINLLIRINHVSLFSYNPKEEKIVVVEIPDETLLEVPAGYGMWQLWAIYGLGESQKDTSGDRLLTDTLTSLFATPIDGFLDFSLLQPQKSASEIIETLRKNPLSGLNLLSSLKTDLTMWELLRLKLGISSVRFDKISKLDLLKLNVLDSGNLPDGTPIFTADPVKLDSVLSDLADPTITSEHKSIAVLNATDRPQLAFKWARLITNMGGNVIITANAKVRLKKTQVVGEKSSTLRRLRQIFDLGCQKDPKCDKINSSDEDLGFSRAQINLLLGEDYINR